MSVDMVTQKHGDNSLHKRTIDSKKPAIALCGRLAETPFQSDFAEFSQFVKYVCIALDITALKSKILRVIFL